MLAMRNLYRVAEAGTCPLGQVARQASIFGGMVMALHPPLRRKKNPQGPATSFVVACAFAPVAGVLGYKGQTTLQTKREGWGTRPGLQKQIARRLPTWRHAGEVP